MWPVTILASDICEDLGDSAEDYHLYIMKKILQGYKRLHIYVDNEISVKSEIIPIGNSVSLPCDFVYETKIGVLKDGVLCTLRLDRKYRPGISGLSHSQTRDHIGRVLCGQLDPGQFFPFYNCYRGGNFLGELYGLGIGYDTRGIYNISNGQIDIGSLFPEDSELVLEYKSDGISEGLELIPTEMEDALRYWAKREFYADKNLQQAAYNDGKWEGEYYRIKKLYSKKPAHFYADLMKERARPTPR